MHADIRKFWLGFMSFSCRLEGACSRALGGAWTFYALISLPLLLVFVPVLQGDVEYFADPVKFMLESIGRATTLLLVVVMAVTPLRMLFPKSLAVKALLLRRRQIGVSVFAYALLHFTFYMLYTGSVVTFLEDWSKLFILSGLVALGILFILAITSNHWALCKLGARRWKRLHALAYPAVILVVYHQAAQEKSGYQEVVFYFTPLALLESYRLVKWFRNRGN